MFSSGEASITQGNQVPADAAFALLLLSICVTTVIVGYAGAVFRLSGGCVPLGARAQLVVCVRPDFVCHRSHLLYYVRILTFEFGNARLAAPACGSGLSIRHGANVRCALAAYAKDHVHPLPALYVNH